MQASENMTSQNRQRDFSQDLQRVIDTLDALQIPDGVKLKYQVRLDFNQMDGSYSEKISTLARRYYRSESRIREIITETGKSEWLKSLEILERIVNNGTD